MSSKKCVLSWLAITLPLGLCANPEGATVIHGEALLKQIDGKTLEIHTGDTAIIDWKDFSIGSKELTRFLQPGIKSAVLNRVTGGQISKILGQLQANGQVFLINPQGILIGPEGSINTAGFIASTLDLSNEKFLQQKDFLFEGISNGTIVNYGVIQAREGDVALFAYQVENHGTIEAPQGDALLGAGHEILLQPLNTKEKFFIRASSSHAKGETGIDQKGRIEAIRAELKADGNLYSLAINQEGFIQAGDKADTIVERDGHIYLVASDGRANVSGSMFAENGDGTGGSVRVLGKDVYVQDQAVIDASGDFGGGEVLLGGDYQGSNPEIPNADITYVAKDVVIKADARIQGDGGKVILWSEKGTGFFNNISARGGEQGGDGGFVETSSKGSLEMRGLADVRAPIGKVGMVLIDPSNVHIVNCENPPPCGGSEGSFNAQHNWVPNNANDTNLTTCCILNELTLGNVTILCDSPAGGAGNITFGTDLSIPLTNTNSLSFDADNDFSLVGHSIMNAGSGTININALHDIIIDGTSGGGIVSIVVSGDITLNAQNDITLTEALLSAADGEVIMTAEGNFTANTIRISGSKSTTGIQITAGNISISGPASVVSTARGDLLMFSNTNISIANNVNISSANNAVFAIDTFNSTSPSFNPSTFFDLDSTSGIHSNGSAHPSILIYTAFRGPSDTTDPNGTPNHIDGSLNGSHYPPNQMETAFFVDSTIEQWNSYYPAAALQSGGLYMIFYKNSGTPAPTPGVVPIPTPPPTAVNTFNIANTEGAAKIGPLGFLAPTKYVAFVITPDTHNYTRSGSVFIDPFEQLPKTPLQSKEPKRDYKTEIRGY